MKALLPVSLCIGLSLMTSACLSSILGSKEARSDNYKYTKPGDGWSRIDPAEADAAYRNEKDQAILNISSVCGDDRYRSLEDLTQDILKQLPKATTASPSEARSIGGFPGMVTSAKGQVDGEALEVRLAVVRTQKCLYDFILAGPQLDSSSVSAFEATLNGFKESAR